MSATLMVRVQTRNCAGPQGPLLAIFNKIAHKHRRNRLSGAVPGSFISLSTGEIIDDDSQIGPKRIKTS